MWGWLSDNWFNIYMVGLLLTGGLTALISFFGLWWVASAKYGLGGLVLGWIPGGVAALVGGCVVGLTWPVSLPLGWWGLTSMTDSGWLDRVT